MTTLAPKIEAPIETMAVFRYVEHLDNAIEELTMLGIGRSDLTLLATERTLLDRLDRRYARISDLDGNFPCFVLTGAREAGGAKGSGRLVPVGTTTDGNRLFASDDDLAAAIAAGGRNERNCSSVRDALTRHIGHKQAHFLLEQLARGGVVLWVRARVGEKVSPMAQRILQTHSDRDLHTHVVHIIGK
ncbi:MAG: hypothetical protein AB7O49_06515 [Sphingomonadales bacterium]